MLSQATPASAAAASPLRQRRSARARFSRMSSSVAWLAWSLEPDLRSWTRASWTSWGISGDCSSHAGRWDCRDLISPEGPMRLRIQVSRKGCAVLHRSRSGYSWRPRPSTFSRVFCSRTSCGCTSMLKRRAVWNSRSRKCPKEMSFRGFSKMVRMAASNSLTRVSAGTQPDWMCNSATWR